MHDDTKPFSVSQVPLALSASPQPALTRTRLAVSSRPGDVGVARGPVGVGRRHHLRSTTACLAHRLSMHDSRTTKGTGVAWPPAPDWQVVSAAPRRRRTENAFLDFTFNSSGDRTSTRIQVQVHLSVARLLGAMRFIPGHLPWVQAGVAVAQSRGR